MSNLMKERIKHVVVIMLENRGFDSVLGYLYRPGDEPKHHQPALPPDGATFHGLSYVDRSKLTNTLTKDGRTLLQLPPGPGVRATNTPGTNPHEDYRHVNVQLYGSMENPPPNAIPDMKGFLQDYSTHFKEFGEHELKTIGQIMQAYTPTDLPVLNGLAKAYAVSDLWFSSVPTQTNANRAFSLSGTSMGRVDNKEPLANDQFDTDTLWHVLERGGVHDWAVFYHENYPGFLPRSIPYTRGIFPRLEKLPNIDSHFNTMDRFFALAEAGQLPSFSYIEPRWGGLLFSSLPVKGNEYHPPSDVSPGEELLQRIYQSLIQNKAAWNQTLLVITCDEHGGTYDHIQPPWGAKAPWGSDTPSFELQHGFKFDRFGVRVPTLLVSPLIEERTVFRSSTGTPFDHTSVIATLLDWKGIPRGEWNLGERVANAPTFEGVITRTEPRTDDVFAPSPSPAVGTPVEFGAAFCLRHKDGDYVANAHSGVRYWFPRLAEEGRVRLDFRLGEGVVQSGATVQLRTSERLEDKWGVPNFLGAFTNQSTCYWYYSDDSKDYAAQYWKVTKADGSTGPLKYGDRVVLSSTATETLDQRLTKSGEWLGRATGAQDWWTLEPPPGTSPDPDVLKYDDACTLVHQNGDVLTITERGRYNWPRLASDGPITLKFQGGTGNIADGGTVKLRSTETDLGDKNILGAFGDSHDLYYWTDGYDANKQGWTIARANGTGDGKIRYGDRVHLTNLAYKQKMVRDTRHEGFITTSDANEWWELRRPPEPKPPDVVKFNDTFYLRSQDGRVVIATERGRYYWPRMGNTGQVKLQLRNGTGELTHGATIKIKSTEDGLGNQNILGAFGDSHDCYYWDDGYDANKQGWEIQRVDGAGDGKIRYGDRVYLTNLSYKQKLVRDGDYLTTSNGTEYWILEKAS